MKMPFFLYCLFFSLWFSTRAHGQSSGAQLLHVALRDASIKELVSVIESQTDLHFYYDKSQFDSLKINIAESRQGLQMLMELAFAGTNFHYSIFGNQVFLTKDRTLSFSLTGIEAAVKMTPGKEYPGNGYQEN